MEIRILLFFITLFIQCSAFPVHSRFLRPLQGKSARVARHATQDDSKSSSFASESTVNQEVLSPRIKSFYDHYYQEKLKHPEVPLWNLLPIGHTYNKDVFANSLKAFLPSGTNTTEYSLRKIFSFNVSSVDMENVELVGAKLHMKVSYSTDNFKKPSGLKVEKFHINVYQVRDPVKEDSHLLLMSKGFSALPDGDVAFDITSIADDWLHGRSPSYGFAVEIVSDASEDAPIVLKNTPLLALYLNKRLEWGDRDMLLKMEEQKRPKRETSTVFSGSTTAAPSNEDSSKAPCGMKTKQFSVVELGLENKIYAPTMLTINYCTGHCQWPFTVQDASNSGKLQGRVAAVTHTVPLPCCAPKEFEPQLFFMYDSDGGLESKVLSDAKVKSCECR